MSNPRMVLRPVSLMNQGALYWCFQLMYHLFYNSFEKVIKTLKIEQVGQYIWRTLYAVSEWPQTHQEGVLGCRVVFKNILIECESDVI